LDEKDSLSKLIKQVADVHANFFDRQWCNKKACGRELQILWAIFDVDLIVRNGKRCVACVNMVLCQTRDEKNIL
jgi:hypothetical protein